MKPLSKPSNDSAAEDLEKKQEMLKDNEKVNIDALFEGDESNIKIYTIEIPAYYKPDANCEDCNVENSLNQDVRRVELDRNRLHRGLLIALALIVSLCFIGLLISVTSALYLQNYRHNNNKTQPLIPKMKNISETSSAITRPDAQSLVKDETIVEKMLNDTETGANDVFRIIFRVREDGDTPDTSASTSSTSTLDPLENDALNGVASEPDDAPFDDLRNDYHMPHEETPSLAEIIRYIRNLLHLPRIEIKYD